MSNVSRWRRIGFQPFDQATNWIGIQTDNNTPMRLYVDLRIPLLALIGILAFLVR